MSIEFILAISMLALLSFGSATAAVSLEKQANHEDLMAGQELIVLGCMGKLKIVANPSAVYDSATMKRIQECADNEGSDITAMVMKSYKNGEIEKSRIATHFLHQAVIFAKVNNSAVKNSTTEDLIKATREQGKKHHPFPLSKKNKML